MQLKTTITPQTVLSGLFLLAAFVISLFFGGYQDITYAPAMFCLLAAALVTVLPACWTRLGFPVGIAALLLFLFWLYITVSLMWSNVPFASLVTYLVFLSFPLVFFTLLAPENREKQLTVITITMLAALTALGGWAMIQVVFLDGIYGNRAMHPLHNPNMLAALLNLGLLPVLAFLLHRKEHDKIYYCGLLAATILFGGLLATQSRAAFIFLIISFFVLLVLMRKQVAPNKKSLGVILSLALALFVMMQTMTDGHMVHRLTLLAAPAEDSNLLARLSLWKQALAILKDNFWTGTGFGTFYLYYPAYRLPGVDNSMGHWAHFDVLQYGAETGFAAIILFYGLLIAILGRTVKALNKTPENSWQHTAIAGIFCALLTVVLHAHASFPLYMMPVLIICGIWLAAWFVLSAHDVPAVSVLEVRSKNRILLIAGVLCFAGVIGVMTASAAAGQHYLLKAINAIKQGNVTAFSDNIEKSQLWGPASFIDPQVQLAGFYVDLLSSAYVLYTPEELETMFKDTLSMLDTASVLNPAWAEIDYKRGLLYDAYAKSILADNKQKAMESWQAAVTKNPMHYRARFALAKHLLTIGRPDKAYDTIKAGIGYPMPDTIKTQSRAFLAQTESLATAQKAWILERNKDVGQKQELKTSDPTP